MNPVDQAEFVPVERAHVRTHLTASNQPIRARLWKRFDFAGHKGRKDAKKARRGFGMVRG